MSRKRGPRAPLIQSKDSLTPRYGGRQSNPVVIRILVVAAAVIVVGALVYSAMNGVLFSTHR